VSGLLTVYKHEGLAGLQRGLGAASLLQFSNVACRFGFYDLFKRAVTVPGEDARVAHAKAMGVGAASGLIAAVVSNPFFLLKTRFQAAGGEHTAVGHQYSYGSLTEAVRDIHATEGATGFFKGLPAFATRVVVASSVQLSTYDLVKARLVAAGLGPDRAHTHLTASLATGAAVVAAMQPFDFACTRMMNEPPAHMGGRYANVLDVLVQTVRHEGPAAVYAGVLANYARFGPYCVLVFLFLEQFRRASAAAWRVEEAPVAAWRREEESTVAEGQAKAVSEVMQEGLVGRAGEAPGVSDASGGELAAEPDTVPSEGPGAGPGAHGHSQPHSQAEAQGQEQPR